MAMLPDWLELCELFAAHGVEYLVVGGQAVIAHGYPRLEFGTPLSEFELARFEDPEMGSEGGR